MIIIIVVFLLSVTNISAAVLSCYQNVSNSIIDEIKNNTGLSCNESSFSKSKQSNTEDKSK